MHSNTMNGIMIMLAASLTFSLMNACVKLLDSISPMELIFFRHAITAIFIGIWWIFYPPNKTKNGQVRKKGGWLKLFVQMLRQCQVKLLLYYKTKQS